MIVRTLLDYENSEAVARWVMDKLGLELAAPYWAVGVLGPETRKIIGGIVFNAWNGANLDITICGPGAMTRTVLRGAFAYAFEGMGATRITAQTRVSNKLMRDILPRVGFTLECELKRYYGPSPDDDALQFSMLRENCSWLAGARHERTESPRSGSNS